jgi:hypothetical protein
MGTAFSFEQPVFNVGAVSFDGSIGYGAGTPDGVLRTTFLSNPASGTPHELAFTMRRYSAPDLLIHHGSLQSFALTSANSMTVGDFLEIQYGGELETIQFMGRANAFRPYGIVDWHVGDSTIVEYRYTTTEPTRADARMFNSGPAELNDDGPRMTLWAGSPLLENAHHHELSVSQRAGENNFQIAYFRDRIKDPALLGVGEITADTGDFLPDVYSGTFSYNGNALETQGVRFVYQRKITPDVTATLDYGYGGVLDLEHPGVGWDAIRDDMHQTWRHSAAVKLNGVVPRWNTEWVVSYRWTSGSALTSVDLFNASAGQAEPFFNLYLRQPFPRLHFVPGRMEALIDLRNLMAQGYVPVISRDGNTVYLVQSARSVRGGLAFTF